MKEMSTMMRPRSGTTGISAPNAAALNPYVVPHKPQTKLSGVPAKHRIPTRPRTRNTNS